MDFTNQLLILNPSERIGSKAGAKELKKHKWMNTIDWKKLGKKELKPPFTPNVFNLFIHRSSAKQKNTSKKFIVTTKSMKGRKQISAWNPYLKVSNIFLQNMSSRRKEEIP